jgi:hypothetical protein
MDSPTRVLMGNPATPVERAGGRKGHDVGRLFRVVLVVGGALGLALPAIFHRYRKHIDVFSHASEEMF